MDKAAALVAVLEGHGVRVPSTGNVSCPFHTDEQPSFSIDRPRGLYRCHSCGRGGDVFTFVQEWEGVTFEEARAMLSTTPAGAAVAQPLVDEPLRMAPVPAERMERLETILRAAEAAYAQSDQAQAYVASRGLTEATRAMFRLGLGTEASGRWAGKLLIPYLGPQGRPLAIRARCIEDHDHVGHGKYEGAAGEATRMYNSNVIYGQPTVNEIHLNEGEVDVQTLSQCGLLAVGFPGVNNIKPHHITILRGFDRVYVWGDNDKAGHAFADRLTAALPQATSVHVPAGDVNEQYCRHGEAGVLRLIGRMT